MSKTMNIEGYEVYLNDEYRPDDYYHYVCEITINQNFVGELSREKDPNIFDVDYDNRENCLKAGIPLEIINKAIEEGKKYLLSRTDVEMRQNAAGLYDYLLEKDPKATALHYPPDSHGDRSYRRDQSQRSGGKTSSA